MAAEYEKLGDKETGGQHFLFSWLEILSPRRPVASSIAASPPVVFAAKIFHEIINLFAVECAYPKRDLAIEFDNEYDSMIAILVSMRNHPENWCIG
jgi:hypothetical protein